MFRYNESWWRGLRLLQDSGLWLQNMRQARWWTSRWSMKNTHCQWSLLSLRQVRCSWQTWRGLVPCSPVTIREKRKTSHSKHRWTSNPLMEHLFLYSLACVDYFCQFLGLYFIVCTCTRIFRGFRLLCTVFLLAFYWLCNHTAFSKQQKKEQQLEAEQLSVSSLVRVSCFIATLAIRTTRP